MLHRFFNASRRERKRISFLLLHLHASRKKKRAQSLNARLARARFSLADSLVTGTKQPGLADRQSDKHIYTDRQLTRHARGHVLRHVTKRDQRRKRARVFLSSSTSSMLIGGGLPRSLLVSKAFSEGRRKRAVAALTTSVTI